MTTETMAIVALGFALFVSIVAAHNFKDKYNEEVKVNEELTAKYNSEKQLWNSILDQQNEKIEKFTADTKAYIDTTAMLQENIKNKTYSKLNDVTKQLSKDNSDKSMLNETDKLLHEFSTNK